MDLRIGVSPEEFPKVAKEMGFGFSLRRGRVDWDRIDTLDVDRLIQERDLMRLHENLNNIVNYSLNNEYDVKILDPNFVKLFRLAQLAVDYLMYSEQHLYNSVELLQHELSLSVKEIDRLKHECRKKDDDLKNMKKQMKERERRFPEAHTHHHHQQLSSDASGVSRCSHCGKMFMSDVYLEAHHTRRHAGLPFVAPMATPAPNSQEIEQLQTEVKRLQEMLTRTEPT
ncbi:cilium assembly protein DZIP1 [Anabrus simplex]|uniref:cilium assembly protein DZIP1 n=1 Tax=Anabrus simplex TaxID=316456 RepID=UPI0035A3659A